MSKKTRMVSTKRFSHLAPTKNLIAIDVIYKKRLVMDFGIIPDMTGEVLAQWWESMKDAGVSHWQESELGDKSPAWS